jgi:hypothetical protein
MKYSWANILLLTILAAALLTGGLGLISGSQNLQLFLWLHAVAGYATAVVLVWKTAIILHRWRRDQSITPARLGFLVLAILLIALLTTGYIWTKAGRIVLFGYSLLTIHTVIGMVLLALLAWHVYFMRFIFRSRHALERRTALRLTLTAAAGLLLWQSSERLAQLFDAKGSQRRFTGSYEIGSLTGSFPTVSWLFDRPPPVDPQQWQLTIDGSVRRPLTFDYHQLLALPSADLTATVDCTGGWYSTQEWKGISLGHLLDQAELEDDAASVTIEAVSGYGRRFSINEAWTSLLATHVAGQPLDHGHGFPLRLVAPGHRGFDWVKWVILIRVNDTGKLWQFPVPLQ